MFFSFSRHLFLFPLASELAEKIRFSLLGSLAIKLSLLFFIITTVIAKSLNEGPTAHNHPFMLSFNSCSVQTTEQQKMQRVIMSQDTIPITSTQNKTHHTQSIQLPTPTPYYNLPREIPITRTHHIMIKNSGIEITINRHATCHLGINACECAKKYIKRSDNKFKGRSARCHRRRDFPCIEYKGIKYHSRNSLSLQSQARGSSKSVRYNVAEP